MFLYKNLFFSISSILSIPIMLIGRNWAWIAAWIMFWFILTFDVDYVWLQRFQRGAQGGRREELPLGGEGWEAGDWGGGGCRAEELLQNQPTGKPHSYIQNRTGITFRLVSSQFLLPQIYQCGSKTVWNWYSESFVDWRKRAQFGWYTAKKIFYKKSDVLFSV